MIVWLFLLSTHLLASSSILIFKNNDMGGSPVERSIKWFIVLFVPILFWLGFIFISIVELIDYLAKKRVRRLNNQIDLRHKIEGQYEWFEDHK